MLGLFGDQGKRGEVRSQTWGHRYPLRRLDWSSRLFPKQAVRGQMPGDAGGLNSAIKAVVHSPALLQGPWDLVSGGY